MLLRARPPKRSISKFHLRYSPTPPGGAVVGSGRDRGRRNCSGGLLPWRLRLRRLRQLGLPERVLSVPSDAAPLVMVLEADGQPIGIAFNETGDEAMIRPVVVALALCVVSSAQSMPHAPLQRPNNSVIQVRQGCGLGRQLVDGICVSNAKLRAAVRKCSARKMRMVNGRCEPRARPAAAPAVAPPTTQQPAATPTPSR